MTGALRFESRVRVLAHGGTRTAAGDAVLVRGADSVTLLIAAATSFRRFDDVGGDPAAAVATVLDRAAAKAVDALRAEHLRDYRQLFDRVTLSLGPSTRAIRPTDDRVAAFASGDDAALAVLYFQYARYLLISSSRPGGQPANLQGLWNESLSPPWGSKYTININTEMNYWPALSTNLAETLDPLTAMVQDLAVTGARTAREMYGAGGWVAHHNTDLWRATAPIDGPQWGLWPTGGAWLDARALGALRVRPRSRVSPDHLSAAEGRRPVLPGHARRGPHRAVARDVAVAVAREPAPVRHVPGDRADHGPADPARPVRERQRGGARARRRSRASAAMGEDPCPAGADADRWRGTAPGVAGGLGHAGARDAASARVASLRPVPRARHRRPADPGAGHRGQALARDPRRPGHRLGHGLAHQPVGAAGRWRTMRTRS